MSTPSAVPRTAPIAIAPKPSRFPHPPSRQGSINLDAFPGSMRSLDSPISLSPPSGYAQSPMRCEACRFRDIHCLVSEDDDSSCISCLVSGRICIPLESPQPRKRKLNGDLEQSHSKRGYAMVFFYLSNVTNLLHRHNHA